MRSGNMCEKNSWDFDVLIMKVYDKYVSFKNYCFTNYHKLSGFKKHSLISSQFCRSDGWQGMGGFSAWGIMKLKSRHKNVKSLLYT